MSNWQGRMKLYDFDVCIKNRNAREPLDWVFEHIPDGDYKIDADWDRDCWIIRMNNEEMAMLMRLTFADNVVLVRNRKESNAKLRFEEPHRFF